MVLITENLYSTIYRSILFREEGLGFIVTEDFTHFLTFRIPSVDYCTSILTKTGFRLEGIYAVIDPPFINPAVYLQKEGPFDKNWRNMDRCGVCLNV